MRPSWPRPGASPCIAVSSSWPRCSRSLRPQPSAPRRPPAPATTPGGVAGLEDRLKTGLRVGCPRDVRSWRRVARHVREGRLPAKLVDSTYLWAVSRGQQVSLPGIRTRDPPPGRPARRAAVTTPARSGGSGGPGEGVDHASGRHRRRTGGPHRGARTRAAGAEVVVYEAGDAVGGMARSFDLWGQRVDLGPHRFFSHDDRVNARVARPRRRRSPARPQEDEDPVPRPVRRLSAASAGRAGGNGARRRRTLPAQLRGVRAGLHAPRPGGIVRVADGAPVRPPAVRGLLPLLQREGLGGAVQPAVRRLRHPENQGLLARRGASAGCGRASPGGGMPPPSTRFCTRSAGPARSTNAWRGESRRRVARCGAARRSPGS